MITVTPGTVPPMEPERWWEGKEARCPRCKAVLKLERADELAGLVTVHADRHPGGRAWVEFVCPTPDCRTVVKLERVNKPLGE